MYSGSIQNRKTQIELENQTKWKPLLGITIEYWENQTKQSLGIFFIGNNNRVLGKPNQTEPRDLKVFFVLSFSYLLK